MDQKKLYEIFETTFASNLKLMEVKNGEYSGNVDALGNFHRGSQLAGVTPLQCALTYASKHFDAIATYVRDQATGAVRPRSEKIEGRLDDLIVYAVLMKALIAEADQPEGFVYEPAIEPLLMVRFADGAQEIVRDYDLYGKIQAVRNDHWHTAVTFNERTVTGYSIDRGVTWCKV
jgi:hypothetical protein